MVIQKQKNPFQYGGLGERRVPLRVPLIDSKIFA